MPSGSFFRFKNSDLMTGFFQKIGQRQTAVSAAYNCYLLFHCRSYPG